MSVLLLTWCGLVACVGQVERRIAVWRVRSCTRNSRRAIGWRSRSTVTTRCKSQTLESISGGKSGDESASLSLQVRADETVLEGETLRETFIRSDLDVARSYAGREEGMRSRDGALLVWQLKLHVIYLLWFSPDVRQHDALREVHIRRHRLFCRGSRLTLRALNERLIRSSEQDSLFYTHCVSLNDYQIVFLCLLLCEMMNADVQCL